MNHYIAGMSPPGPIPAATGIAVGDGKKATSEVSANTSAVYPCGCDEPRVSPWILVGIAAIAAAACFIYKFSPAFEHGRVLPHF